MHLIPPMYEEPPDDFVTFVAVHLTDLQREAARLTGGPQHADEVYPDALADVAGHWRRLRLRRRLTRHDPAGKYLAQRLAGRAKQWREDQVYEVEVSLIRAPVQAVRASSIALRKAPLLPGTVRAQARPLAEAAIAWSHAWTRARWRRLAWGAAVLTLALIGLAQALPQAPQ